MRPSPAIALARAVKVCCALIILHNQALSAQLYRLKNCCDTPCKRGENASLPSSSRTLSPPHAEMSQQPQ